jgi:hypothetical protein
MVGATREPRTLEQLSALLGPAERDQAVAVIEQLRRRRFLVPAESITSHEDGKESPSAVFYWQFGLREARVVEQLRRQRIALVGINHISLHMHWSLQRLHVEQIKLFDIANLRGPGVFDFVGNLLPL